jgi:hypothetical protein
MPVLAVKDVLRKVAAVGGRIGLGILVASYGRAFRGIREKRLFVRRVSAASGQLTARWGRALMGGGGTERAAGRRWKKAFDDNVA